MAGYDGGDDFDGLIVKAAYDLMGLPNKTLSKAGDLRFGTKGAISIIPDRGVFFDHHDNHGGGVLQFVQEAGFMTKAEAVEYLHTLGLKENDDFDNGRFTDGRGKVVHGAPREHVGAAVLERTAPVESAEPPVKAKVVATYDYVSEDGELIQQVLRMDPKTFRQRRPEGDGWSYKVAGNVPIIPYRLPELGESLAYGRPIWIVEGEKDVDALLKLGITATCNAGGSGKWTEAHAAYLVGANVIICPDNDDAGKKHCEVVGRSLEGVASKIRVLNLPDLPEKGDVSDFLAICEERGLSGLDDVLWNLAETRSRPWGEQPPVTAYGAVRYCDLDLLDAPEEYIIKGVLPRGGIAILYGDSGAGKSFLSIDMAMKIAQGQPWFDQRVRKGGVIYQAGEGQKGILKRFRAARDAMQVKGDLPIVMLTKQVDLHGKAGDTKPMIVEIQRWSKTFDVPLELVVIDTLAAATAGADENSAQDMTLIMAHCKEIQEHTNATVMIVHHRNAAGAKMRGHTSFPAGADATIEVTIDEISKQKQWKTVKQKEGAAGRTGAFDLMTVRTGTDRDGDPITSCIVDPIKPEHVAATNGTTSQKAGPKLPDGARVALRALQVELAKAGSYPPEGLRVPERVRHVTSMEAWRERYFRDMAGNDGTKDALAKNFRRQFEVLMARQLIERSDECVWTTLAGDRTR